MILRAFVLPVLVLAIARPGVEEIRSALSLAGASESERKAFTQEYEVRFPSSQAEHVAVIEVFTPFRQVVERAVTQYRLGKSYTETEAEQDLRDSTPSLRILVRVVLPPNRIPIHSALPFGSDFKLILSYRRKGNPAHSVIAQTPFRFAQTCRGIVCPQPSQFAVDGALLETSIPLNNLDLEGPLKVTVVAPSGESRTARFHLDKLR